MNDDIERSFLVEGLKRYPQAMATIELFQNSVQEQLSTFVTDYEHEWLQIADSDPEPAESNSKGGRRLSVYQEARARDGQTFVCLEIGVWWQDSKVALFASLWDEDDKRVRLPNLQSHQVVKSQIFGSNKWRLFLPIEGDADLQSACKVLVDVLAASQGLPPSSKTTTAQQGES